VAKLEPGDKAPDFDLPDSEGNRWKLSEHQGSKVIVYFYPIDDTPGCTREACDFRDSRSDLEQAGVEVAGISPQDEGSHRAFTAKYDLNFPLLVDADMSTAKTYGALDDRYLDDDGNPIAVARCTFVIDEDGVIEQALYGVKAKGHVAALKDSLKV
jgi:thioredoxin-dependent peroxiredoxin